MFWSVRRSVVSTSRKEGFCERDDRTATTSSPAGRISLFLRNASRSHLFRRFRTTAPAAAVRRTMHPNRSVRRPFGRAMRTSPPSAARQRTPWLKSRRRLSRPERRLVCRRCAEGIPMYQQRHGFTGSADGGLFAAADAEAGAQPYDSFVGESRVYSSACEVRWV